MIDRSHMVPAALGGIFVVAAFINADMAPWAQALLFGLALLAVCFSFHVRLLGNGWGDPGRWFLIFLFACLTTLFWSQDLYTSVYYWSYLLLGYVVFQGARQVRARHRQALLQLLTALIALQGLWALVEQVRDQSSRAEGFLGNANALGALLGLGLPLSISMAAQSRRWWRWLFLFGGLIIALALLRTFSLTTFFALALSSVLFVPVYYRQIFTVRSLALAGLILFSVVILSVGVRSLQLGSIRMGWRLDQVVTREHFTNSFGQRELFILSSLRMVSEYPVAGVGLGAYQLVYPRFAFSLNEQPRFAHNAYLEVFAEAGLISGVLFLGIFYTLGRSIYQSFRKGITRKSADVLLIVAVTGGMFAAVFDFGWHFPMVWLSFWFLAGTMVDPLKDGNTKPSQLFWGLVFLVVVVLWGGTLGKFIASQHFERAEHALQDANTNLAVDEFKQGLHTDPQPRMRGRLAVALWLKARRDPIILREAESQLNRNVQWSPTDYFTYHVLGRVLASANKPAEADQAFQQAIAYSAYFHPEIHWEYANFLITQKRYTEAREVVDTALYAHQGNDWSANPDIIEILGALREQRTQILKLLR